jgi:hypothetical protein
MAAAGLAALGCALLAPAAWILALAVAATLLALWIVAVGLFMRADAWGPATD